MKVGLFLSRFNTIIQPLPKKIFTYCSISVLVIICAKFIKNVTQVVIQRIKEEKATRQSIRERNSIANENLIKEEQIINKKLKEETFAIEKELRLKEEQILNKEKELRLLKSESQEARARDCFMKLRDIRILRNKPFKEAEEDIKKRMLECGFPIPGKTEDIDIGRYRTFGNVIHRFQDEYDDLPEDTKRELTKENSLFLSHRLSRKTKLEIMRNADHIRSLSNNKSTSGRFTHGWDCISQPVLDNLKGVFYKPGKSPDICISAAMLRYHMKKLGIKNIILPRREFWTTRDSKLLSDANPFFFPEDDSAQMSTLMLEDCVKDILPKDECSDLYINNPDIFNDAVVSISKIFCFVEIGDVFSIKFDILGYPITTKVELINESGKYIVKTDNPDFPSQCRFDNLPLKRFKDAKGDTFYKVVLVDLDLVKKPNHATVEKLLRMFPKHQQLIVDTIQETNPDLFKGYNPQGVDESDTILGPLDFLSTKDEIISNYKNNKDKLYIRDPYCINMH